MLPLPRAPVPAKPSRKSAAAMMSELRSDDRADAERDHHDVEGEADRRLVEPERIRYGSCEHREGVNEAEEEQGQGGERQVNGAPALDLADGQIGHEIPRLIVVCADERRGCAKISPVYESGLPKTLWRMRYFSRVRRLMYGREY